jgi:hypothetical protein
VVQQKASQRGGFETGVWIAIADSMMLKRQGHIAAA